jgi:type II secretory ATPase GspE/PulE/Tfp pilus assembly ATPase PilB-like protein
MDREAAWLRSEALGEDEMRRAAAYAAGVPFVVLEKSDISLDAMFVIPEPLSRTRSVVAYARGEDGSLEVALLDLADLGALEFLKPIKIKPRLTTRRSMTQALLLYQKHLKEKFETLLKNGAETVDSLLRHALMSGATHIHLEPGLTGMLVRYRIGGILNEAMRLSQEAGAAVVSRFKQLAKLFPVETAAQDGGFKFEHQDGMVAVGVSTLPTIRGEKVLLRLAHERAGQSGFTLAALGFHGRTLERVHRALEKGGGLIVVNGPADAGKTTLLYCLLDALASPRRSLASVEECRPALTLPGVWQTHTRPELGLTTAAALRAALRTDPDAVMIDALDSPEAARAAMAGARRGILILATARDSVAIDEPDLRVELRLMRRLCPRCREQVRAARAELGWLERQGVRFGEVLRALKEEQVVAPEVQLKDLTFYRAKGCGECERGFKGFVGIQALEPQEDGDMSLTEDALYKAAAGLVALDEIIAL